MNLTDANLLKSGSGSESGLYQVPPEGVTILIILYLTVALTAIIGNIIIVIVIARSKKLRGVTNYFIANLAAADIMIGSLAIPFTFQAALLQKWVLPSFMCSFCPFIQTLSLNVSIFTLVAVALDRFRAVIFPLRARTAHLKTKLCIIPIWLFSFLLSVPTFLALKTRRSSNGNDFVCDMIGMDISLWKYYNHTLVILQYFIPLAVIVIAYTAMGIKLYHEQSDVVCARSDSSTIQENRKKVVKMMIIVVFLFGSCWLPYQMYNILSGIYPDINEYRYINLIFFAFHLLAMSNSCFNPFIYFFYSELYNSEIKFFFKCCFPGQRPRETTAHASSKSLTENESFLHNPSASVQVSTNNSPHTSRTLKASTLTDYGARMNNNGMRQQKSTVETVV